MRLKRGIDYWCENKPLKNIRFSGGEPTLYPDIIEIVKYCQEKGIERIAISTNGSSKLELYQKLVENGVNDFSVSLDTCCSSNGDKIAGRKDSWYIVVNNIRELSKLTYVTVGIVLMEDNIDEVLSTIKFVHNLGVSDIRIISAAQYNKPIERLNEIEQFIRDAHPILDYRISHFNNGRNVRGITERDSNRCALILDDSIIAGDYHFPCVIYMREGGSPIGVVSKEMRKERVKWSLEQDCYNDSICRKNCLDVCIDYNNRYRDLR